MTLQTSSGRVILSGAKNPKRAGERPRPTEMLRAHRVERLASSLEMDDLGRQRAQHDISERFFHGDAITNGHDGF